MYKYKTILILCMSIPYMTLIIKLSHMFNKVYEI